MLCYLRVLPHILQRILGQSLQQMDENQGSNGAICGLYLFSLMGLMEGNFPIKKNYFLLAIGTFL